MRRSRNVSTPGAISCTFVAVCQYGWITSSGVCARLDVRRAGPSRSQRRAPITIAAGPPRVTYESRFGATSREPRRRRVGRVRRERLVEDDRASTPRNARVTARSSARRVGRARRHVESSSPAPPTVTRTRAAGRPGRGSSRSRTAVARPSVDATFAAVDPGPVRAEHGHRRAARRACDRDGERCRARARRRRRRAAAAPAAAPPAAAARGSGGAARVVPGTELGQHRDGDHDPEQQHRSRASPSGAGARTRRGAACG